MQIGELARATGTTPRALRYYEEQGLLRPSRTGAGYRVYDDGAVTTVGTIRHLLASGFTVDDLRSLLALLDQPLPERFQPRPACADALAVAVRRLDALEERIADLTALRDRLAHRLGPTR
ncbi:MULTISPECIES: MerR family transcriptional regulator [Frankia]|uniref:MerR-family transcriptional regulator n=1 Tax=Frankia alni (strain DSM 45986 / CECT 9034 / ACN14a) TaxID=326424 RepID=Q0RLK5_FRAAA|nr:MULTISPECIES: MerR family transcriptional regulator [Frankia]CAJ61599.1 putative MerR-family transcriptional regulator [Frankia alni ACN14a]